jgi:hypothetical protein
MAASKKEASLGQFDRARETKNFVRFEKEDADGGRPLTMYVPNEVAEVLGNPDSIIVNLSAV